MNAFLSTVRRISWFVALGALLFGVSLLDKALGTGSALLGVAAGLSVAGGTLLFLIRRMGRLAQRAADDQRKRLKPPPFPEDPYASYDWRVRTLGSTNPFITNPEEGGPFSVVLFYMDAPGKREEP